MDGRTKKFVEVAFLIPKGYPIVISYDCVGFDSSFYEQSLSLSHPYIREELLILSFEQKIQRFKAALLILTQTSNSLRS